MMNALYFLCVILAVSDARLPLPKEIHACSRNDPNLNECFGINANLAMSYIVKGDAKYNISNMQPLEWHHSLPLAVPPLTLVLKDILIYGVENFTIFDPHIDLNQRSIQFIFYNDHFFWKTQYKASIDLIGPHEDITGDGQITFLNGKWNMTFEYDYFDIDGVQYANITNAYAKYISIGLVFNMGDIDTNPVFQEEWDNVKRSLFTSPRVEMTAGLTTALYFNSILNVVPFNEVFTP